MMFLHIKNFLPQMFCDELENLFEYDLPWYFNKNIDGIYPNNNNRVLDVEQSKNSYQFTHVFYNDDQIKSPFYNTIRPIFYYLFQVMNKDYTNNISRIKGNLLTKDISFSKDQYHRPHVDSPQYQEHLKWISMLYYVNDSDGDTFFFKEFYDSKQQDLRIFKRIPPEKGTAVVFDSNQYHASSPPIESTNRCVISFVLRDFD